jgi:radical SAM enzyme (TIGR01210 family)
VAFAKHVIVECHPRLVGPRALLLRELLAGSLEVAMGLETVHPEVLPRLNKRFTLDHFADAVEFLRKQRISVRAFILVKPPFIREDEAVNWAVESARFAFSCGADVVSLIPTRAGNGAMDALAALGEFSPPKLETLESSQEAVLALEMGRVFADTWDLSAFSTCSHCLDQRRERLEGINLGQAVRARVHCESCGAGRGLLT